MAEEPVPDLPTYYHGGIVYGCFFRTSPECILETTDRSKLFKVFYRGEPRLICKECLWHRLKKRLRIGMGAR